ncbi:hypothetical protein BG015_004424 [Linnemannia schmuckeri]|uniref:Uncharacterized protein n=1 Tax=Linnemannia schmuckeri TaxID=64567 RepID=A0A9P5RB91_9FUNG|nr:hypothetical protein BG015_004424 [Linnemannia schmuckeri]
MTDPSNQLTPPDSVTATKDNQVSSVSASTRALNCSEVLYIIGDSFFFECRSLVGRWTSKQNVEHLLSFMQVSRLWHKVFHPILWSHSDAIKIRRFTSEAVSINSHHLKYLRQGDMDLTPFRCTQLVLLELTKAGGEGKSEIEMKRRLVQSNLDLEILLLDGFGQDDLRVEDFVRLTKLQELTLRNWANKGIPMSKIIRPMADTLRVLDLDCIHEFAIHDPTDAGKSLSASMTLPHLTELRVDKNPTGNDPLISPRLLQDLVKLTPALKSLKLTVYEDEGDAAYTSLAECLRSTCPLLDDVEVYWTFPPDEPTALATFLRKCSYAGLVRLYINQGPWSDDLLSAIISHARTLKSLYLHWDRLLFGPEDDLFGAYFVLGLLLACRHLKYLGITDVSPNCRGIFDVLDSHTWGCSQLEEIEFCLGLWRIGDDDPEDCEYAGRDDEIQKISKTNPIMGWYRPYDLGSPQIFPQVLRRLLELSDTRKHVTTLTYNYQTLVRPGENSALLQINTAPDNRM